MSNKIDANLVRHIGKLSRIELTDAEVDALGCQMADILEYFDKLQELDTQNVEPMAHAVELSNVLADDVQRDSLTAEQALANAPAREGDFFKVPKVLGEGA
ncbi:MAG: Asp-tRNA(Asn)/Glu-tRNA(Gln) amidotransferase subunit GatC [Phycisphaerae bacterium]|nr:Asp-tRNA(Asn)/Glu-tRNA(Gln) amidotransferase subunit GatC [Phycisphaerae bacterium]